MGKHSHCTCTICDVERSIAADLELPENHARYLRLAANNPLLAGFPTAFDLVDAFHACKDANDGHDLSDRMFRGLLYSLTTPEECDYLEKILMLFFAPTAHAVVRHVSCHYRNLAREDLSQLALTTLIQSLRSKIWQNQRSHFGYTVTRSLRRSLFQWARGEFQSTPLITAQNMAQELRVSQTAEESFERNAILRLFLASCHKKAYLTPEELNLLIDIKLGETVGGRVSGPNRKTSNPIRQKIKRLMTKLRRVAQNSANKTQRKIHSQH